MRKLNLLLRRLRHTTVEEPATNAVDVMQVAVDVVVIVVVVK